MCLHRWGGNHVDRPASRFAQGQAGAPHRVHLAIADHEKGRLPCHGHAAVRPHRAQHAVLHVRYQVVHRSPCNAECCRRDQQTAPRPCPLGLPPPELRSIRQAAHPGEGPPEHERNDQENCTHAPAGNHPPPHDQQQAAPTRHGGECQAPHAHCRRNDRRQPHAGLCTCVGHGGYDFPNTRTVALSGRNAERTPPRGHGKVTSAGVVYRRPLGDLGSRLCGEFGGQGGVVGF